MVSAPSSSLTTVVAALHPQVLATREDVLRNALFLRRIARVTAGDRVFPGIHNARLFREAPAIDWARIRYI